MSTTRFISGFSAKAVRAGCLALFTGSCLSASLVAAAPVVPTQKPVPFNFVREELTAQQETAEREALETAFPLPKRRPAQTGQIDVLQLLNFGTPPVPRARPVMFGKGDLRKSDIANYKKVFSLQSRGEWDEADDALRHISDMRLRGHVLYQRYMHPSYKATFDDLKGWLDLYADLPGAHKIHSLAEARRPRGNKEPLNKPALGRPIRVLVDTLADHGTIYDTVKVRKPAEAKLVRTMASNIRGHLSKNEPEKAWKILTTDKTARFLEPVEYDNLQAHISVGFMHVGKLDKARDLAQKSAARSQTKVPLAGWTLGMVSWREGRFAEAAKHFELAATSSNGSAWGTSAGAYWASRAHMRAGHFQQVSTWLNRAAEYPRTFYGLIACRALGKSLDHFNWQMPELTDTDVALIESFPQGRRAAALIDIGQYSLAEAELTYLNPGQNEALRDALIAFASDRNLPGLALKLAGAYQHPDGGYYDGALYPLAPWKPEGGYRVDRALIHALIRQESQFNPAAENPSGATGLMQLMPATASYVSQTDQFKEKSGRHQLKDPNVNIDLGQRYVESLLNHPSVGKDLLSMAIAYNAGPGNLARWKSQLESVHDPLLFIESVPISETRAFVERVMANYWIYSLRLGQPTPSLDAVAAGEWARYVALDDTDRQVAFASW